MTDFLEDYSDVLTPENIMRILKIGKNTVYNLLQGGAIKSIRIGNQYRVPKQYIHEFLFNSTTI